MVRKRQSEKGPVSTVDLASSIGFSPIGDGSYTSIKDMLPTFIPQWDYIMGGGIPFGRLTEVYAPEQVGKSTLMIYLNRVANALGADVFWLDAEGTSEGGRMQELGVDTNHTFLYQPDMNKGESLNVEQVGATIEKIIEMYRDDEQLKDTPLVVIWDSIGGTVTKAEQDTEFGQEGQRGRQAAAVTKLVRKVTPMLKDVNIALIAINQVRANQDRANPYAPKTVSGGGEALKHADSLRLELAKSTQIKGTYKGDKEASYEGHLINMKIDKSKQSRPHQSAKAALLSGWLLANDAFLDGIDYEYNMYTLAKDLGLITTGGAYRKYTRVNGEEIKAYEIDFLKRLKDDPDLTKELFIETSKLVYKDGMPRYLKNENLDTTRWPGVAELKKYYEENPVKEPEDYATTIVENSDEDLSGSVDAKDLEF